MKKVFRLTLLTIFAFIFVLSAMIFTLKEVSAKTYDKTPEECTHNQVQIESVAKTDNRLNINTNWKNDNVVQGSTGVAVQYPFDGTFCVQGTATVTLVIELEEAKEVNVYWSFGKQAGYNNGYITIKHDDTVIMNNANIVNAAWNIDTVQCHAGKNTLVYACRYQHLNWREVSGGRWFYVMPDYLPTFDGNDRCTQCGIQCSHEKSSTMFDDNEHWFQCQDLCHKTFSGTRHEHVLDQSKECMNCRYVEMEKDSNDYYLISNPAQLAVFTKYINEDAKTNIKGRLTADLNLNGCDFEPIGTDARMFVGEFDGGNHRIYFLNLNDLDNPSSGLGFFGTIGSNNTNGSAKISNLTIDKSCSFASNKYTAGIAGYAIGDVAFDHCGNEADITSLNPESSTSISGGIIAFQGQGVAKFSYCYNTGTILGGSSYWAQGGQNGHYYGSGGICGFMQSIEADHCYNAGEVTTVLSETPTGKYYEPNSIHNTPFGNAFGSITLGDACYNYCEIPYDTKFKTYTSLTDGSLVTPLNGSNTGVQFIQGAEYPVFSIRKEFADHATCEHEYVVSRYEWKNDHEICRAVAVCSNCGIALTEEVNSTETVIYDVANPGLEIHYFQVDFVHDDIFVTQKIAIEIRLSVIHNITLHANGGQGTLCTFYYEGVGATLPTDYKKDDNYIEGWYDNEELSGEKVTEVSKTDKEDKEFWAKYADHTCTLEDVNAVAPTCTEAGMTAGKRCSVCGEIREGCDPIRPLGHSWVFTTLANRDIIATCDHEGCGKTITISLVNRGNSDFVIEGKDKWAQEGFIVPDIYYEGTGTTVYEKTIAMPTKIGTFKASMTYEGNTVSINFSISFVDLDPESMTAVLVAPGNRTKAQENDVLECKTDATPATIKWYYDDDNDGKADDMEPIDIGKKYQVKSKDDGHRIIAVVTQPNDGDGNPRPADQIPTITTNNILIVKNLDPSETTEDITGVHVHRFEYTAQDNKIVASCSVSCDIRTGLELVLSAPKNLTYDGKAKVVELNSDRNSEAFPNPQVKYFQNGLEIDEVILPGTYLAKVTYGNAVAILEFEVTKGIPTVSIPSDLTASCGETLGSIDLPNGWSWLDPDQVLEEAGLESFGAIYTPENLDLYQIVSAEIGVNVKWDIVDDSQPDVVISIKNSDGVEFDTNISIKVEVKTDVQTTETKKEYKDIQSRYLESGNEISFVYSVKLIRTINGVEEEIQPEDIAEGTIISIQMKIPEELKDKDFKVLHIHNDKEVSYVNYKRSLYGEYITVEVSKLSEFAFVTENAKHGFCVGYVVLIFALLLLLWLPIYIFAYFGICEKFMKACKLDCLSKKLGLLSIINICVAGVLFIFALVALALHTCPVIIVSFILVLLLALAFLVFFLMPEHNEEKEEPKAEPVVKKKKERMVKKEEPVQEEKANEPVLEEPQEELEEDDDEEEEVIVSDNEGHYFKLMYNKSFMAKLIQASDDSKAYYQELKNEILSYKGTTSRISWNYDSINKGRANLVKFNFKRKHLYVYFALNADDYTESKYNLVKVESKKYQSVPAMFAVRNNRNVKYAKELIEVVCTNLGLEKGDMKNENYILPYEETKPLLERGLIKEVRQPLQDKPEPKPKKVKVKTQKAVSANEVNKMMSNEDAKNLIIEERKEERVGKKGIINVDVLARFFNDGDTVTIEKLKEKGLIANNVAQVKVLAYGILDKKLNVELQDFSIEAAKMIILTGGTVKEV